MNAQLSNIDFAALRTLRLVFRRGSFTEAAAELNVNQSTVSYTIDRLRRAFDDPLFVRQGATIAATDRCRDIVSSVEVVLGEIERAASPAEFDPAVASADISISATYLSRSVLMPPVLRALRRASPGIHLEMITGFTNAKDHLLSGRADIALTPVSIEESGIYGKRLLTSPYVCVMDKANPLTKGPVSVAEFASARHLVIHYGATWRPIYLQNLDQAAETIDVVASTPDPADLPHLIPGTDLVCALPELIARQFASRLHISPCPVPAATDVQMYWPARLNRSPLNEWLRGLIEDAAASVEPTMA
ncbi:LysR family transcriptional regulator [Silicimonas sp. MF1-12-2]|uniref:LysR family transcriptional regulator n=1 Tax=Silicimonas sp. MF1-12-2 TaxID=3384793 RepID=UPI0039B66946